MRPPFPSFVVTVLVAALGLFACEPKPDGDLLIAEGEHIDIYYEEAFDLCEGTIAASDRGIEFVAAQLGLDTADFEHLRYMWLSRARLDEKRTSSTENAAGWASGRTSYGGYAFFSHEITHSIAFERDDNSLPFLREGLATAFDEPINGDGDNDGRLAPPGDPRPEFMSRNDEFSYDVAAGFVAYLLSRHGQERFWELYESVHSGSTESRLRRRFAAIYGLDLDAAVDDYLLGECPEDALPIPLPRSCGAEELPWRTDGTWIYSKVVDCEDEEVAGGINTTDPTETLFEATVTVEVPQAGLYSFEHIRTGGFAILYRCGGCPWLNQYYFPGEVRLAAGRHSLRLQSWQPQVNTVSLARIGD